MVKFTKVPSPLPRENMVVLDHSIVRFHLRSGYHTKRMYRSRSIVSLPFCTLPCPHLAYPGNWIRGPPIVARGFFGRIDCISPILCGNPSLEFLLHHGADIAQFVAMMSH